jgi:hypothetical protein
MADTMKFDAREPELLQKPLTLAELRLLRENWKHHPVIAALVESAFSRRRSGQITPV